MIPKPTTRDEARTNATDAAENAHHAAQEQETGPTHAIAWADVAQAWAAIAETFPADDKVATHQDMVMVHQDFVHEADNAIAFKNRMRVEPGYAMMAVTSQEQRTIMALRTGHKPSEPVAKGIAVVPPATTQVKVDSPFYMALMAILVATIRDTKEQAIIVHPEDIDASIGQEVMMSHSNLPDEGPRWRVWVN